jgi:hypothetical protein
MSKFAIHPAAPSPQVSCSFNVMCIKARALVREAFEDETKYEGTVVPSFLPFPVTAAVW